MTRTLLFPLLALAIAAGIWWATMRDTQEDLNAIDPAESFAGAGAEPARDITVTRRTGSLVTGTPGRAARRASNLPGVLSA